MPIASFQGKTFQVSNNLKYTFFDFSMSGGGLEVDVQEKLKSKPSSFIKGIALKEINFTIPLKIEFGLNPMKEIDAWETIKLKGVPAYFILGTKPYGTNKWLLISTEPNDQEFDGMGNLLKANLKITLQEYVREGSQSASGGTSNTGIVPSDYNKRNNPNVALAKATGVQYEV